MFSSFVFAQEGFLCPRTGEILKVPSIVKRADWGARATITKQNITVADTEKGAGPVTEYADYGITDVKYSRVILHNSNMMYEDKNNDNKEAKGCGARQAKYIQDYEMDAGTIKADMGYNFVIDRCGVIYEGRSLSYFPSHAGATSESVAQSNLFIDPDYGSIGVLFINHFNESLTLEQVEAVKQLIEFGIRCYEVNNILTHAEVKIQLEDGTLLGQKLTPLGKYDAQVCPGKGPVEEIITIRKYFKDNYNIPFDEDSFRKLFL